MNFLELIFSCHLFFIFPAINYILKHELNIIPLIEHPTQYVNYKYIIPHGPVIICYVPSKFKVISQTTVADNEQRCCWGHLVAISVASHVLRQHLTSYPGYMGPAVCCLTELNWTYFRLTGDAVQHFNTRRRVATLSNSMYNKFRLPGS